MNALPYEDRRREGARMRKQEQRERERLEKERLLKLISKMEKKIDTLLASRYVAPMVLLNRLPHEVKAAVVQNRELTRHGNRLSSRLEELAKVISILSMWVFLQAPHEPKPTMMESTLLGNEECRNTPVLAVWRPNRRRFDCLDAPWRRPYRNKDRSCPRHSQFTVFGNYSDVAQACWDTLLQELSSTVIDKIHDDLVYFYIEYGPMKTKLLRLAGMFRLKNRIVITQTTIAYDERYPMKEQESRLHGFGWTILDEIGEGITLWRQSNLFYTPVNQSRPLVLEEIGDFVHYQLQEGEPRETVIIKYHTMVENGYILQRDRLIKPKFPLLCEL
ncbi:hypothetical protein Ae201684_014988 [Aphanomyces euteiches]|uniref:Uncharacterized protein n=1 Tax=Aphanomyces euteiches TaxID=100861 RepID=A0A6G0WI19_9STRA|nr:hypothetical protein Ae201684_014988 [Aphanomyces euteiches]